MRTISQIVNERHDANTSILMKLRKAEARMRELFEEKFTRSDWEANNPEAMKYFEKCRKQANAEIFGL